MTRFRHFALATALTLLVGQSALAHCDTMDGPVVAAARQALQKGDVNPVLIWVSKDNEAEIKAAFQKTLAVRKLNPAAKDLADTYFFETLVRVHRQGEGAPYTGLKPAGSDLGPAIPAADKALASGDVDVVHKLLADAMQSGLRDKFEKVHARKNFAPGDIAAGREYVEAYVTYLHYVERLYEATKTDAHGHYAETAAE